MALEIFRDIASTIDDALIEEYENNIPKIVNKQPNGDSHETPHTPKAKRPRFKFSMVDIKIGEYVTFGPTGIEVRVASDDSVEYDGRIYKLSPFVGTFLPNDMHTPSDSYQGANYFYYKGRKLKDLRNEKEAEKKDITK